MRAFEARAEGKLIYVDADGTVVRRTVAKAALHVANHRGLVDIDVLRPEKVDGRYGYLGPDGSFIAPPAFADASHFYGDRAFVAERAGAGSHGTSVLHWRLVDRGLQRIGELVLAAFHPFAGDVAPARLVDPNAPLAPYLARGLWGLLAPDGTWHTTPRWDWLGQFCDGRAAVGHGGKYGFIDTAGRFVVEPRYDLVTDFCDGMAQVAMADATPPPEAVDAAGRLVITPSFSGTFGVIDRDGSLLHPLSARAPVLGLRAGQETREGRSVIQEGKKYGYADLAGHTVIAPQYDYAVSFAEGRACVRLGKKEGFIDLAGRQVVAPSYEGAHSFSEGLAAVKKKQWGFIDRDGELVIAPRFGPVSSFKDGRALVWLDKARLALIAPDGTVVWQET